MRYVMKIAYDGTDYAGWQRQKNGVSIQETLEKAIETASGEKVVATASGRTDAGVHAEAQVVHFDADSAVPAEKFYKAINPFLPKDIKVISSCQVDCDFNARKSAKRKTYRYKFYFSEVDLPLKDRYAVKLSEEPDFEKIKNACALFVGEHDFKAFSSSGSSVKTTVRTVYSIDVERQNGGFSILITGNGFLYNMVRIISGVLLDVGYGKKTSEDILLAFETRKREVLGKTLPAKGLTLVGVEY